MCKVVMVSVRLVAGGWACSAAYCEGEGQEPGSCDS